MSYRILNQNPAYYTLIGNQLSPVAGGSIQFYASGATVPADTFSDIACTIPNTNPVLLDAYGRTVTEVWGNTNYTAVLSDANGVELWTRDNVQAPNGLPSQAGNSGKFPTTDGMNISWVVVNQVPDTTGQPVGNVLGIISEDVYGWTAPKIPATGQNFTSETETVQTVAAAANTTLDWTQGLMVIFTQNINCILAFSNLPSAGKGQVLTMKYVHDGSATVYTLTWPGSVIWRSGSPPTLPQTGSAVYSLSFLCVGDGVVEGSY